MTSAMKVINRYIIGFISFVNNGKVIGKVYIILSPVKVAKRIK